nr:acyltransferase family protein [uncultured Polaribacter sp.]
MDQVKGLGIILVVYGHNFPIIEDYIYSFHMPLFFLIAGIFHPEKTNFVIIKKRVKQILVPYFLWSFLLYFFWLFVGRNYGESSFIELSPYKNLIGIFFAQGDKEYMNWEIPMWFLPSIFLTFLIFWIIKRIIKKERNRILLSIAFGIIGFVIPRIWDVSLIWSLDVSLTSLIFYVFGYYSKKYWVYKKFEWEKTSLFILFILHILCSIFLLQKVDMYRSNYGNEILFILNAFVGVLFWCNLLRVFKFLSFLSFFGKNTIPILAMQLRSLTVIKLILLIFLGTSVFNFNELEKVMLVFFQLLIMYPILLLINKYLPILNGKN